MSDAQTAIKDNVKLKRQKHTKQNITTATIIVTKTNNNSSCKINNNSNGISNEFNKDVQNKLHHSILSHY